MVSLRLDVRHGLVVGGGPAAVERVRALLHAGAQVKLVAPEIALELRHRAAWGEVLHLPRSFRESDKTRGKKNMGRRRGLRPKKKMTSRRS